MCRSCEQGGRRCPRSESTRATERAASSRYYQRGKARRKVAELADAGIPAITDSDMPASYHQHDSERPLDLEKGARETTNPGWARPDKPEGALWSSPGRTDAEGGTKTAWTDWAARDSYLTPGGGLVAVKPQAGAVVVCINDPDDAESLMGRYGRTDDMGERAFDWQAMRQDGIDGVYVSDDVAGGGADRRDAAGNFYGWDSASVAWLSTDRLEAIGSRQAGTYEYEGGDEHGLFGPELRVEDGYGDYDEPARPDLSAAWDRVPRRFRSEPGDEPAAAEPRVAPESSGGGSVYEYSTSGKGGKMPKEMDLLDLGTAALKGVAAIKGKGKARAR